MRSDRNSLVWRHEPPNQGARTARLFIKR